MKGWSAARWRQAEALFEAVVERESGEWPAFLDEACGSDAELRTGVEELLRLDRGLPDFLEGPAIESPKLGPQPSDDPLTGRRLGAFQVLRRVGEGGMGRVYEAERVAGGARQRVAVKILAAGGQDAESLGRLHRESRILARLVHPHIARFVDAGTTEEGWPYLVMEYVDGLSITAHCDAGRLDLRQRIGLLVKACDAVEYAHRNLVVHRDLKPGNLLVTEAGDPKLLDFGVSKLLEPTAGRPEDRTSTGDRRLTPAYASPEQLAGLPVTTASDVYSLGVLLYELLCGDTPAGRRIAEGRPPLSGPPPAPSQALSTSRGEAAAQEEAAARQRSSVPGKLRRQLRGDLDSIVLRCLHPSPEGRYASVADLREDLERYLHGLPVSARGGGRLYRLWRFARRNAVATSLLGLLLTLAVGWGATTAAQRLRLGEEVERANRSRTEAEAVTRFLMETFSQASPYRHPETAEPVAAIDRPLRQALMESSDRLALDSSQDPLLKARLLLTLGKLHLDLGSYSEAVLILTSAAEIHRRESAGESLDAIEIHLHRGRALAESGCPERAETSYRRAVEIAGVLGDEAAPLLPRAHLLLGELYLHRGDLEAAGTHLRQAVEGRRFLGEPSGQETLRLFARLAEVSRVQGDLAEAERLLTQAGRPPSIDSAGAAAAHVELLQEEIKLREAQGDLTAAEEVGEEVLRLCRRRLGEHHPEVYRTLGHLARMAHRRGALDLAEARWREALGGVRKYEGPISSNVAAGLNDLGLVLRDQGRLEEAEPHFREALEIGRRVWGEAHPTVASALFNLGGVLRRQDRLAEAEVALRDSLAVLEAMPQAPAERRGFVWTALAGVYLDQGKLEPARRSALAALPALEGAAVAPQRWSAARLILARALIGEGDLSAARAVLTETVEHLDERLGAEAEPSLEAHRLLREIEASSPEPRVAANLSP